jgi:hypothetical protein
MEVNASIDRRQDVQRHMASPPVSRRKLDTMVLTMVEMGDTMADAS